MKICAVSEVYIIKLVLGNLLITKSGKVITKNMHKTLCVAQNIGPLIRGRQYCTATVYRDEQGFDRDLYCEGYLLTGIDSNLQSL